MSLNDIVPSLRVMKNSSPAIVFRLVKSKVSPPVVIRGAPKNWTTLPTFAKK